MTAPYLVCDYCAHVETPDALDDRPSPKCENCAQPLDARATFDTLGDAEGYSEAVIAYHEEAYS